MRLKELIKKLKISLEDDFEVAGITCNSKEVRPNFVFVAVKGTKEDGHKFIKEAINNGARAVIVQSKDYRLKSRKRVPMIVVQNTRKVIAELASEFYGNPSRKLKVIGITGTNGKTTVSYLIEGILKEAGFNPAVIGTINYRFGDLVMAAKNTTPGPLELQSLLAKMLKKGVDYLVMEVSSHALDQERTRGIDFYAGIFTNLTHDHLDYHKTQDDYFQAKTKLFKGLKKKAMAIINHDDIYGRRIEALTSAQLITYGIENASDIMAYNINLNMTHTEFCLKAKEKELILITKLIGRYNVYNILAAIAFTLNEGISLEKIKIALEKFSFVPGRLERIDTKKGYFVFVDYAHTEDALKNVLITLRELARGRVIVVFGCGGERDKTKRPKMGKVVSELADYAIITSDNPRSEDPRQIISQIQKGMRNNNYSIVIDRRQAIKRSLALAKTGDIVLIAGKGHENYQVLKDTRLPFDDRKVVRECLKF
ncbi:MAG: UDP-N-acetylmuramoyl-L-alanyl-D-glutamate--2,6-diaminopimelate ligase [Candidatus Omnitrophica bacterium]|nr:UDP-N-acetylmuramoyl-L-alanyl-D-glutamate--2,6-diaminopimelate ligase [Candidatus Omnitrophota bacterium]